MFDFETGFLFSALTVLRGGGWERPTVSVDKASLQLNDPPASISPVLGSNVSTSAPSLVIFLIDDYLTSTLAWSFSYAAISPRKRACDNL